MTISVGDRLPNTTLVKATADGPDQVESETFFAGRRVALKAKGIDEVACTSVNDAFVMDAWGKSAGAGDITLLADGNGDFAKAVGLTMDGSGFGMGTRSQRYSMIVNDGVVEQLNVEAPGEFKVSSAEHLLSEI
jgi:peroxiredoxin